MKDAMSLLLGLALAAGWLWVVFQGLSGQ